MEMPEETCSVEPDKPVAPTTRAPPAPGRRGPSGSGRSTGVDPDEVPVGLIEDDLVSAELCNESIDSLRRVYKHFKVMLFAC